jgi:hypothetical protein
MEERNNFRAELDLDKIHASFFQEHDKDRFNRVWSAIAKIASLPPGKLRPQDNVVDLFPQSKWSSVSAEEDDLTDLVLEESKGREIPKDLRTVGAVVKFLLEAD